VGTPFRQFTVRFDGGFGWGLPVGPLKPAASVQPGLPPGANL